MKWRHLVQFQLEMGSSEASPGHSKSAMGLLYDGGIAGESAKRRFDELNMYFFVNFYSASCPEKDQNMAALQRLVEERATSFGSGKSEEIETAVARQPSMDDIQNDILHRVFYHYMMQL